MLLRPHTCNGFIFNTKSGNVNSDFQTPYDWNIAGIDTTDIPRSQNFPARTGKNYTGQNKVINVNSNDIYTTRDDFISKMDILGEDQLQLISLDEQGRAWYINVDFIGLNEDGIDASEGSKTGSFDAIFKVDDPIWKRTPASTATIEVDATGSGTIIPIGNQPALPIITITPLAAGEEVEFGFAYKRFVQIINNSLNAMLDYPLDITDGGLDTAALIGDGKMLSDGNDLRIYIDGVEVKRWFGGGGINSATTTIWVNWTQPANSNVTLGDAISDVGDVTEIVIENTAENVALLPIIPISGNVLIGSEIFVYTGVDIVNLKLTGVTRAQRQTTAAAHAAQDVIEFVTHDCWIYYGAPNIAPYVVDDSRKPIFDIINSTNTLHIYASQFRENAGTRSGSWLETIILLTSNFPDSQLYTGEFGTLANPATALGTYIKGKSVMGWRLHEPVGVTEITVFDGNGYSVISVYGAVLESSADGVIYETLNVFDTPSPLNSWVAFSTGPFTPTASHPYIRIRCFGGVLNQQWFEVTDVTLTLDSTLAPTINVGSEVDGFASVETTFENSATGDIMQIVLSMDFDTALVINTKEKTITLYDGTNAINSLIDMPIRAEWFRLLPGVENDISITDPGQLSYLFEWEDRYL